MYRESSRHQEEDDKQLRQVYWDYEEELRQQLELELRTPARITDS